MTSILIKNATFIDKKKRDILVNDSRIAQISEKIAEKADETIDAANKLAIPGLVNAHTHVLGSGFRGLADDIPLKSWLEDHMWPAEDKWLNDDFARKWAALSMVEMIKCGTTAFVDLYSYQNQIAEEAEKIGIRGILGEVVMKYGTKDYPIGGAIENAEKYLKKGNSELVKRILAPHAIYTCDEESLVKAKALADRYKTLVHLHLSETKTEVENCVKETGKTPVDYLESINFLGSNVSAAHCVHVTSSELLTLKKHSVTPVHCPVSNLKLGSGIAPVPEMLGMGLNVCIGTDSAASNNSLNMFGEMKTAALIHKGVSLDPTVMPAEKVFALATENAYKAFGIDAGLKAGKLADIVLMDLKAPSMVPHLNLLSNLVYSANGSEVTDVIINGKVVLRNRKMATIDEKKLIDSME